MRYLLILLVMMNSSLLWGDEKTDNEKLWNFKQHVIPILSKKDCNSGGCHGALAGKGGFRLSLQGYNPEDDYYNIVKQDRGRRVELNDPARSLFLLKPAGVLPHKGGKLLDPDSREYRVLVEWIAQGTPGPSEKDPVVDHLEISPVETILQKGQQQQFTVTAIYNNGFKDDVTSLVKWSSANDAVAQIDKQGKANITGPGMGAIVAWYDSKLVLARIVVPFEKSEAQKGVKVDERKPRNLVDEHVDKLLGKLNLQASPNCSDEEFIRRVTIDILGRLPTMEEARDFLASTDKDKRDKLIQKLTEKPDFADYWTYRWSDMLQLNGTLLRPAPLKAYYQFIHNHVEKNTPWDVVVREIITSTGESQVNGATNFFALNQSPEDMVENSCQAFLGLSIGCAKCHNHPLEKWTNDQYYGVANMFSRVKGKGWGGETRNGDGFRTLFVVESGELVQPRTGKPQPPCPLDGKPVPFNDPEDRRVHFANWMTSPENPYFARAIVNRVWANFMGVGLVEKVDDLRISNPASNEKLHQALAKYLIEQKFDLKKLMVLIMQSNAYQRSSKPLPGNAADQRFYSHFYPRRMMAEVLHDAVVQVTDVTTKFDTVAFPGNDKQKTDFYPEGTRAIQLYDAAIENYFLSTFGRNQRMIVCDCERSQEPTMVQVMHISNGDTFNEKLKHKDSHVSKIIGLRKAGLADDSLFDEIYLTCFSRYPTSGERTQLKEMLPASGDQEERAVLEDIYWALMSSREFLFNH